MAGLLLAIPASAAEGQGSSSLTWLAVLAVVIFIAICVFFPKKPRQPGDYSNKQDTIDRLP